MQWVGGDFFKACMAGDSDIQPRLRTTDSD